MIFKIQSKGFPSVPSGGLPLSNITDSLWYYLKAKSQNSLPLIKCGCGGWIWTNDLRVMSPTSYHAAPLRDIELFAAIFDCLFIIALGIGYVKQKINNSIKKTKRRTLQRQNRANCMKYRKCTAHNSALTISIGYYIICEKTEIMMSIWSEWIYKLYIISFYDQNYTACII